MRLISWNTCGRVGAALDRQADALAASRPDLVALQEVLGAGEGPWRERLARIGLEHVVSTVDLLGVTGRPYANLVASRWPLVPLPVHEFDVPYPERIASALVCAPVTAVELHVAHLPSGVGHVKQRNAMLEGIHARLARAARRPRILCGRVGSPGDEARGLGRLAEFDLADVHRGLHEPRCACESCAEATSISDRVLASAKLAATSIAYRHDWRRAQLSDHPAAVVEFAAIPAEEPITSTEVEVRPAPAVRATPPRAAAAERDAPLPSAGMRRLASFADSIRALPDGRLDRAAIVNDTFRLHDRGSFAVYYAPFDWTNRHARIALVASTPGMRQVQQAFETARDVLVADGSIDDAGHAVKAQASLAGMRERLVGWLDGIGVDGALGLESTAQLFGEAGHLLHTTSVVRYPVLTADGSPWSGRHPGLLETPALLSYVDDVLGPELDELPAALVVPLGATAWQAVRRLIDQGRIDRGRCLRGVPDPSKTDASSPARYELERERLAAAVAGWARGTTDVPRPLTSARPAPAAPAELPAGNLDPRLPGNERLEALVLEALSSLGGAAQRSAIMQRATELGRFTAEQRALPAPPSKRDQYPNMLSYRLGWALSHLSAAGQVVPESRDLWRLDRVP